jgi:hypothetical protein
MWKEEILFWHLHGRAEENLSLSLRTVVVPEEIQTEHLLNTLLRVATCRMLSCNSII